jgi:hypothetical protein
VSTQKHPVESSTAAPYPDPDWEQAATHFQRWPALIATVIALILYVTLPGHLYYGPVWLMPAVEAALAIALLAAHRLEDEGHQWQRGMLLGLLAVMNAGNIGSLLLLVHNLVSAAPIQGHPITALNLMEWSAQIWLTNVIIFGLWYWEFDRGGPIDRLLRHERPPDFLFPQLGNPDAATPHWMPTFFDYLYTSFTNAAAFSPTDTLPLTHWAKALFMVQSLISVTLTVLVISRIANILP